MDDAGARRGPPGEIDAALAEAETGVFISSEAMHAWMATWDTPEESSLAPERTARAAECAARSVVY